MQLLLISSSYAAGTTYLGHAKEAIEETLSTCPDGKIIFVPYARQDWDAYAAKARPFFESIGQEFVSIHEEGDPKELLKDTPVRAFFVGGGNTFRLLKTFEDEGLLEMMRRANFHRPFSRRNSSRFS